MAKCPHLLTTAEAYLIDEHAAELEGLMRVQGQFAHCSDGVEHFVHGRLMHMM